jgi:uncharacterized membrane protein
MSTLSPKVTWPLSIFLALAFSAMGFSKVWGPSAARWGGRFLAWGYPAGAHYVVGIVEILSGIALLVPRTRVLGAGSLLLVMTGALVTHLIHGELGRTIPPVIFAALLFPLFRAGLDEARARQHQ